jgi:molecular chaperone DnaK (HSP70)
MGLIYGIDFGTAGSSLIVGRDDGTVERIKNPASAHGSFTVPSSVCEAPDGSLVVGAAAELARIDSPERYRNEFKREFGDMWAATLGARAFRPHELAAEVLGFLRALAENQVPGNPELTVIAVPAAWEQGNRDLMVQAARIAGFDPTRLRLVPEPVAAAQYALAGSASAAGTTLVYDLGETFDCALVAPVAGGGLEVLGLPGRLAEVGGGAFDQMILDRIRRQFPELAAKLLDGPPADRHVRRRRIELDDLCEQLKIQLSVTQVCEVRLTDLNPSAEFRLTRAQLAELIRPLLLESVAECKRMLSDAEMDWPDVDRIVPVGGSCRLPLVSELLEQHTGRPVLRVEDPQFAVAHGAALRARAATDTPPSAGLGYSPEKGPFE